MMVEMQSRRAVDLSCLASARSWRQEAACLRDHADRPYLTSMQRAALLRQAEAAERQADWWLEGMQAAC